MRHGATDGDIPAPRALLDRIAALFALFVVLGPAIVSRVAFPGVLNQAAGVNTFFEQYRRHEPVFLVLMAAFAVGLAIVARRAAPDESTAVWASGPRWSAWWLSAVAVAVFAIAAIGTSAVMHSLPLAMDEYGAVFQSKVFAAGQIRTTIPAAWQPFGWSMTPVFVALDATRHEWISQYLPLYAGLRALCLGLAADRFLNPALAAASIPLVYLCANRLWPNDSARAWLAVAFLALSTQMLFMSMTAYAMPAHLVVNLLWLYAFLRNDRAGWLTAPWIGVVALGLHNPFPHALFVTPFLFYVLFQRRWAWTAYFAVVYLAGIALWYWWAKLVHMGSGTSLPGQLPNLLMLGVQELSLTVLLSWQTPVLAIGFLWALASWRSLSTMERLLAAGVAVSFLFYFMYPNTQGHGWGYRYTYATLGSMALLGASGIHHMRGAFGATFVRRAVVASALATIVVQLPVRLWQVERYVRPFAMAHDYIAHLDADVVIVDPTVSWYGIDLVRNDPFLRETPKVISAFGLRPELRRMLAQSGGRVHMLRADELARLGLPTFPSRFKRPIWPPDDVAPTVANVR